VGRVRSVNEDNYLARDDTGIWAVADGMGGHRGGDVASEIACEALGSAFTERTVEGLVDAIDQANRAVFRAGSDDPDLTGMGTTIVALAVVAERDDELLAVANVGDSRVYRYTVGDLEQLTDDHSLVAELVREGTLSPEEAAVHPQRNIVTRVLGVYDSVPVDAVAIEPRAGDRYVLCSDGLFNEVPENAIAAVLRQVSEPAEAADELVRLAVDGGGRDNVTVVVVDVVDDGGRAEAASAAVGADEGVRQGTGLTSPAVGQPRVDPDTDFDADADGSAARGGGGRLARLRRDGGAKHTKERSRRVTWRVVLFTVILLALVAGAFATIQWYGQSTYFVGFDGDRVAIFKGRPGGVLWIDPTLEERSDLERDRVPVESLDDLEAGKEQSTLDDARSYVERLTERADELDPETTPTTRATTTTTTTAPRTGTTRATTTTAAR
jgi:protein phosphatase